MQQTTCSKWQNLPLTISFLIAYFYSPTPKTLLFTVKISRFLAQNWNQCNFGWRLLKFGCQGNSFGPLKFPIIYVNSLTPNTLLFTRTISQYFIQKWNLCNFGLFLPIWLQLVFANPDIRITDIRIYPLILRQPKIRIF